MATITAIKGGPQAGGQPSGLQRLQELNTKEAGDLLARLGNDLNNKTGVVRLLHTSKADKDMKFQTAGSFKQMFLDGGKLDRSGQVIRDLLARANATREQLADFDAYLGQRGRSGVQADRVREEIKKLGLSMPQYTVGSTHDEALTKLGLQINQGKQLGAGTYGTVYAFSHGGKEFVVKRPNRPDFQSWQLRLEAASTEAHSLETEKIGSAAVKPSGQKLIAEVDKRTHA